MLTSGVFHVATRLSMHYPRQLFMSYNSQISMQLCCKFFYGCRTNVSMKALALSFVVSHVGESKRRD